MRRPKKYDFLRDGVTYTMLSTWLSCRQQCRYRLEGWTSVRPKEALSFGSFVHDMLRTLYDRFRKGRIPNTTRGLVRSAVKHIEPWIEAYVDQHTRMSPSADYATMLEKHAALCEAILPLYVAQWEEDFRKREWLDLESEFDVPYPISEGLTFRLRGKRDGVFRKKRKRGLWLLETKTKGRIEKDLIDVLAIDAQNLFYMWATFLELGEMPIGVDYNIVRRPSIVQGTGEEPADYAERVAADIEARSETYFVRMEAAYAEEDVRAFGEQLQLKLRDFQAWSEDPDAHTYRNEGACIQKWTCDYLRACTSGTMHGYVQTRLFSELG